MPTRPRLPTRFPNGTKYVVEGRGAFVRRYVEFPNGRRIDLATRNALSCTCGVEQKLSIAPDLTTTVGDASVLALPVK
jgi:hypothetical protein